MTQNITLLGASYSNVPAVTLPKTGGGTARFTDVSDSTVTESTVLAGYKAYNASGTSVTGIYAPNLQEKTVTPTIESQTITNDSNYEGLSQINLNGIPYNETENSANGKTVAIAQGDSGNINTTSKVAHLVATRFVTRPAVVENESNMWTGIDSDTYATISSSTTSSGSTWITGFDFSSLPNNAVVQSYSIKIKGLNEGSGAGSSTGKFVKINNTYVGDSSRIGFSAGSVSIVVYNTNGVLWEDIYENHSTLQVYVPYGNVDNPTRIYGVEIEVTYSLPVNKAVYGTTVLIDLTSDTVTADRLAQGYTAHDASGGLITGDAKMGSAYQDLDGYVVIEEDESSAPQGILSITANGTYDVSDYAGANVQLGGMSETDLSNYILRNSRFTDIDWPDGLTNIGSYAFANCASFKPASLPSGLTSISPYAFQGCTALALTSLPSGLTSINTYAFQGCTALALTSLPSGLTSIGSCAFNNCTNLAITEIPSGVTSLTSNAFVGCTSLRTISSEAVITSASYPVFTGNTSHPTMQLESASFPNMALTSNINYVFGNLTAALACQLLEFCDIGSTVGIASNAFANCYALETLVLRKTASVCTLANVSAFTNTPMSGYNNKTGTVYVPSALISSYQAATNWSTLYNNGTVTFSAIEGSKYERN